MNKRLRELRKALGLKQEEIAKVLGIGQPTYSQFETGATEIRPLYLEALQSLYGANPEWLMTGKGHMFIQSIKDEEFLEAYQSLSDESKELIRSLIIKLRKAEE